MRHRERCESSCRRDRAPAASFAASDRRDTGRGVAAGVRAGAGGGYPAGTVYDARLVAVMILEGAGPRLGVREEVEDAAAAPLHQPIARPAPAGVGLQLPAVPLPVVDILVHLPATAELVLAPNGLPELDPVA